jgi:hypothetical protein
VQSKKSPLDTAHPKNSPLDTAHPKIPPLDTAHPKNSPLDTAYPKNSPFGTAELSYRIGKETEFETLQLEGKIDKDVIKNIENAKKYLSESW